MFAKVFQSLWQGSLVGRSDAQLVFVFLLAHADASGEVDYYHPVIAALTGIPEDRVRAAVLELESADGLSRSPDEDGRRIVRLDEHRDWGWQIVNYTKYRAIRDAETRREQNREAVRRHRAAKSARVSDVSDVSDVSHDKPQKAQAEVEAEVSTTLSTGVDETGTTSQKVRRAESPREGEWRESFPLFWEDYPRKQKRPDAERAWMKLPLREQSGFDQVLAGLERWKASKQWHRDNGQFIPLPASWLNARLYDDNPEVSL